MKRREFITLLGVAAAAWPLAARAQQIANVFRIGLLGAVPPSVEMLGVFRDVLQQHGYIEGKNLSIDVRWPKGSFAQDPGFITTFLQGNFDIIVAWWSCWPFLPASSTRVRLPSLRSRPGCQPPAAPS